MNRSASHSQNSSFRRAATRTATTVVAVGVLAACGTAPLSFINDRQVYYKAVLNRYPVYVTAVDSTSPGFHPVPVTAGDHRLTLDATPVAGFSLPVQKIYPMTIQPCTRYYLAAQRTSPLIQDWELVVEETWPVAGCDPVREIEKARQAAAAGEQPPLTSVLDTTVPAGPQRRDGAS